MPPLPLKVINLFDKLWYKVQCGKTQTFVLQNTVPLKYKVNLLACLNYWLSKYNISGKLTLLLRSPSFNNWMACLNTHVRLSKPTLVLQGEPTIHKKLYHCEFSIANKKRVYITFKQILMSMSKVFLCSNWAFQCKCPLYTPLPPPPAHHNAPHPHSHQTIKMLPIPTPTRPLHCSPSPLPQTHYNAPDPRSHQTIKMLPIPTPTSPLKCSPSPLPPDH